MSQADSELARAKREIDQLKRQIDTLQRQHAEYFVDKENHIASLRAELAKLRWFFAAKHQARRLKFAALLAGRATRSVVKVGPGETIRRGRTMLAARHAPISQFYNPYSFIHALKPIKVSVEDATYAATELPDFSVITTVKNEAVNITKVINALARQTALPAEVIVVDGGSTDGTVELLRGLVDTCPFDLVVVDAGDVNIASGRNIALDRCSYEIVVLIDAGSMASPGYCRALVGSMHASPDAQLVGGTYTSGRAAARFVPDFDTLDFTEFLPSARSLALRRDLARVVRFPEFLTLTGEDTLFDVAYRRKSTHWVFNRSAVVEWQGPSDPAAADRLERSYASGDGESGFGDFAHYRGLIEPPDASSQVSNALAGYAAGRLRRAEIEVNRRNVGEVYLILAGVPFTDSGGGQRGTQLALELLRQGQKVVFVNIYPSFEDPHKFWFDVDMSLLELYSLDHFDTDEFVARYAGLGVPIHCILEFPHPRFIPVYEAIRRSHTPNSIVFDYIDNWSSSLGWEWYTQETENKIVAESDVLVASAVTLQKQLESRSDRAVALVPNAVNAALFGPHQLDAERPDDFPAGELSVTYVGALWGEWFDWAILVELARARPDVSFVLIGNRPATIDPAIAKLANVEFLGLKAQSELPAYLAHSTCCIIPFKLDHITEFVNPLKVYEYLAMGRPVLAAGMPELEGLAGVVTYRDVKGALDGLDDVLGRAPDMALAAAVAEEHGWRRRVGDLRSALLHPHGT